MDDEVTLRNIFQMVLHKAGYQVETAGSVEEALEQLDDRPLHVALTDLMLPRISGMELAKHLKLHHPETGVILMSGDPSAASADEIQELGVFAYLHKPFNMDSLLEKVAAACRQSKVNCEDGVPL